MASTAPFIAKPEPNFASLPFDILLDIADHLPDYASINSLSQTNRHFYAFLNQYLYKYDIRCERNEALWWGVQHKRKAVVQRALDFGGDMDTSCEISSVTAGTLLFEAILPRPSNPPSGRRNAKRDLEKLETVRLLLDRGASTDPTTNREYTALMQAAKQGDGDVVRLLVERGADWRLRGGDYETMLHYAAYTCDAKTIRFLVDLGLDVNDGEWVQEESIADRTPLHRAAASGNKDAARALIEMGASVHSRDIQGNTPLHAICASKTEHLTKKRVKMMVLLLIKYGAEIDTCNDELRTPLFYAVQEARLYLVSLLIGKGADVRQSDKNGITMFLKALCCPRRPGGKELLQMLVQNGADVNRKPPEGGTALHFAAGYGNKTGIRILLANGLDVNARDELGQTALHYVTSHGDHVGVASVLLENGIDPNAMNAYGHTALHGAAARLLTGVASLLLEKGSDVNARDNKGVTPLHYAVRWPQPETEMIELLLRNGADFNRTDDAGVSPYHLTIQLWDPGRRAALHQLLESRGQAGRHGQWGTLPWWACWGQLQGHPLLRG